MNEPGAQSPIDTKSDQSRIHLVEYGRAAGVAIVLQIAMVAVAIDTLRNRELVGTDPYMRLNRVQHLWSMGNWSDATYPRIGPDGLLQHWTRPLDAVLIAGGSIGVLLGEFGSALYWTGALLSPILLLPTVVLLLQASRPLMSISDNWIVVVFFVTQISVLSSFQAARPDHNALLILLFAAYVGTGIRTMIDPTSLRPAIVGGIVGSVGLWVSIEFLIVIVGLLGVSVAIWIKSTANMAHAMLAHSAAMIASILIWLPVEFGLSKSLTVHYDQTSIAHVVALAAATSFWGLLALAQGRRWSHDQWKRLGIALGGAAMGATIIAFGAPGLFESPLTQVDELYRTTRLERIAELQPVVDISMDRPNTVVESGARFLRFLGISIPAAVALIVALRKTTDGQRRAWVFVGFIALIYGVLTFDQVRWAAYASTVLVIPYAAGAQVMLGWLTRRFGGRPLVLLAVRPLAIFVLASWSVLLGSTLLSVLDPDWSQDTNGALSSCPIRELSTLLADPDEMGPDPLQIMAFVDFGPELLYRTPHSVMSIPNHRLQPGYSVTYEALSAPADAGAALLASNDVDLVIVCHSSEIERTFYVEPADQESLYNRLRAGDPPETLRPIDLPDDLAASFRVYRRSDR